MHDFKTQHRTAQGVYLQNFSIPFKDDHDVLPFPFVLTESNRTEQVVCKKDVSFAFFWFFSSKDLKARGTSYELYFQN